MYRHFLLCRSKIQFCRLQFFPLNKKGLSIIRLRLFFGSSNNSIWSSHKKPHLHKYILFLLYFYVEYTLCGFCSKLWFCRFQTILLFLNVKKGRINLFFDAIYFFIKFWTSHHISLRVYILTYISRYIWNIFSRNVDILIYHSVNINVIYVSYHNI